MLGTTLESAPEDPAFEQLSAAVKGAFRDLLGDRFSMRELSQEVLGTAPNRLVRFMSGERPLSVEQGMRLLDHMGADPVLFLELVLARLPKPNPATVVRQLCLASEPEPNPFLVDIETLLAAPGRSVPDRGSRMDELDELDRLRFGGTLAVRQQVEEVCRELALVAARPGSGQLSARRDLIRALGLWSTISRTLNERSPASLGYSLAFRLAAEFEYSEGVAILKKRASFLLVDSGYPSFALSFLSEAAEYFLLHGDSEAWASCLVDRGIYLMLLGQLPLAEQILNKAVASPFLVSRMYRASAHQWLSLREEARNDIRTARKFSDLTLQEYELRDSIYGHFCWFAAKQAVIDGANNQAESYFRQALKILSVLGRPFEAERLLVDLAELQLRGGRILEVRDLGRQLLSRIPINSHSRKATEALVEIANCLIWRSPEVGDLSRARTQLIQAGNLGPPLGMCKLPDSH